MEVGVGRWNAEGQEGQAGQSQTRTGPCSIGNAMGVPLARGGRTLIHVRVAVRWMIAFVAIFIAIGAYENVLADDDGAERATADAIACGKAGCPNGTQVEMEKTPLGKRFVYTMGARAIRGALHARGDSSWARGLALAPRVRDSWTKHVLRTTKASVLGRRSPPHQRALRRGMRSGSRWRGCV